MNNRRTGKIARLPKELRDRVNTMIQDGKTYPVIIKALEKADVFGIADQNLTNWKDGGYKDWEKEQERLNDLKFEREFAIEYVKAGEGSKIPEAALLRSATQINEVLSQFDVTSLLPALNGNPKNFAHLVNALAKTSKETLAAQKYRDAVTKAQTELKKLREPKAEMSDAERNTVLDKVDEILGLK